MNGSLPLGATTPDGRAFRVTRDQWLLAVTRPDGPQDPLARHVLLTMVLRWANWDDGAKMFAGREMGALASARNSEDVRQSLAYGYEEGWLWRYGVRGTRSKFPHFVYETTLPIEWLDRVDHLRDWEKDPAAIEYMLSTRKLDHGGRKRRRKRKLRDRAAIGRSDGQEPARGGRSDHLAPAGAQPRAEDHKVQGCTTSSSTSPSTFTKTSSADGVINAIQGIEERMVVRSRRRAALLRPLDHDPVGHIERCFRMRQAEGKPLDPFNTDDVHMAARSCWLTDQEAADAIRQLVAEGRLPLPNDTGNEVTGPPTS
jgi:hypothetical protein